MMKASCLATAFLMMKLVLGAQAQADNMACYDPDENHGVNRAPGKSDYWPPKHKASDFQEDNSWADDCCNTDHDCCEDSHPRRRVTSCKEEPERDRSCSSVSHSSHEDCSDDEQDHFNCHTETHTEIHTETICEPCKPTHRPHCSCDESSSEDPCEPCKPPKPEPCESEPETDSCSDPCESEHERDPCEKPKPRQDSCSSESEQEPCEKPKPHHDSCSSEEEDPCESRSHHRMPRRISSECSDESSSCSEEPVEPCPPYIPKPVDPCPPYKPSYTPCPAPTVYPCPVPTSYSRSGGQHPCPPPITKTIVYISSHGAKESSKTTSTSSATSSTSTAENAASQAQTRSSLLLIMPLLLMATLLFV